MKRIFYGWYMVAAGCGLQFLQSSLLMQSFGAYVAVLRDDRGWSKTALARPRAFQPFARPRARRHFRPGDRLVACRLRLAHHRVRLGRRLYPGRPAARLDHPPPARGPRRDDRWLAFKNRNCECFRGERRTDP